MCLRRTPRGMTQRSALPTITLSAVQSVMAAGIMLARHSWPRLFTDSPAVVARTAGLLPLFALRCSALRHCKHAWAALAWPGRNVGLPARHQAQCLG